MWLVGLTGGIGCGKTTVAAEFQRLGIPCFVADRVGTSYYDDARFCRQVADVLGREVLNADGGIDRRAVAEIVFADNAKLLRLNALVHPRVMSDFEKWCQRQSAPYVLFESAIIYEYDLQKKLDAVVAVYLDLDERLARLQVRDNATTSQLMPRINAQMSAEEKMMRADYVVLNYEGNPRRRQVEHIHNQILKTQ